MAIVIINFRFSQIREIRVYQKGAIVIDVNSPKTENLREILIKRRKCELRGVYILMNINYSFYVKRCKTFVTY